MTAVVLVVGGAILFSWDLTVGYHWLDGQATDREFGETVGFSVLAGLFMVAGVVFGPVLVELLRSALWVYLG